MDADFRLKNSRVHSAGRMISHECLSLRHAICLGAARPAVISAVSHDASCGSTFGARGLMCRARPGARCLMYRVRPEMTLREQRTALIFTWLLEVSLLP